MTVDPRAALDRFVAALEAHFQAVSTRREEQDPAVDDAYDVLGDAFDVYAESLGSAYHEALPFDITDDDDDDDDDEDDDDDDDDDDEDVVTSTFYDVDKVPDEAFADFDDED